MSTTVEKLQQEHGCTKDQAMLAASAINKKARENRVKSAVEAGEIKIDEKTGEKRLVIAPNPFEIVTGGDSNMLYGTIPDGMDGKKFRGKIVREIYEAAKFHKLHFSGFVSLVIYAGIDVYENSPLDLKPHIILDSAVDNDKFIVKKKN